MTMRRAPATQSGCAIVVAGMLGLAVPAAAEPPTMAAPPTPPAATTPRPADTSNHGVSNPIQFSADRATYDSNADVVTVTGHVQLRRLGYILDADQVTWDRRSGQVVATGSVRTISPQGDIAYADRLELTDTLRDGMVDNLLLVMANGARLVARSGHRVGGVYNLNLAAYSPCAVIDTHGCPKSPTWQVRAVRVTYDAAHARLSFSGASLRVFGLPILPLPIFSTTLGDLPSNGLLLPEVAYGTLNGGEVAVPYYIRVSRSADLLLKPHIYTAVLPLMNATYRQLTDIGAFQITGYGTFGNRATDLGAAVPGTKNDFRGYIDANGQFHFGNDWALSFSIRRVTDRTFLRRYDIATDDRLRSNITLEHIDDGSYLSVAGWATQTLRIDQAQGQVPTALPEIDYRRRLTGLAGGTLTMEANTLAITRTAGQDTQRAFIGGQWDRHLVTAAGQLLTFTLYARGDIYHSDANALTTTASYQGTPGWQQRAIVAGAIDARWPLAGPALGGTQILTPHVELVVTPPIRNLSIPNEDSRSVELDDVNLFAINRFPGYDRFEDASRLVYGLEWSLTRPDLIANASIGQSYAFSSQIANFPVGTGLANRVSDIVGRADVRWRDYLAFTLRYRLDKDTLGLRRLEGDTTIGSTKTYAQISYIRLNRGISPTIEDLRDSQELRLGGRVQFGRFWSVFGSTIIDLTTPADDPTSLANGYQPVRHRLGVAYDDDCLSFGVTWKREYLTTGDARRGNAFLITVAFRNLGV